MALTYRDGMRLPKPAMCHRCGAPRDGVVRREGPRWTWHLSCGHVKTVGWTMPVEELRKRELVTTQTPIDPRAVSSKRQEAEDKEREHREKTDHAQHKQTRTTKSRYL